MVYVISILGLAYLISCGIILYHTTQSFDAKYKDNIELQAEFVRKMKKHFLVNLSLLTALLVIIFIKAG